MRTYIMYTLKHVSGGRGNRTSLNNLGQAASVRNASDLCHTLSIGHVQSGLGVQAFKYWRRRLYSPALPSSSTLSPVSNLNPSWTPSPYLKPQCHLVLCIGALPAWAAQPAAAAAASRLFLMTTKRPLCITRAAANATSPCAGSRPSLFS